MPNAEMETALLEKARPRAVQGLLFGARARRLHFRSCRSQRTFRRADFHAFAFKSCAQFARKFNGAGCIAVDTDRFAAHLDILAFD